MLNTIRNGPHMHNLPSIGGNRHEDAFDYRRAKEAANIDYVPLPASQEGLRRRVQSPVCHQSASVRGSLWCSEDVRDQILGLIQYEFRTPLTLVMGYAEHIAEALADELPNEDFAQSVSAIVESSHRLQDLVECALLLGRLSSNVLPEDEIFPLDPNTLWHMCLNAVCRNPEDHNLKIVLNETVEPVIVFGILEWLRMALSQLLEKVIRERSPRPTILRLSVVAKPDYVGWRIHLEERKRADRSRLSLKTATPSPGGSHFSSLGLALVRRVVELHDGYLEIEQEGEQPTGYILWVSDAERI